MTPSPPARTWARFFSFALSIAFTVTSVLAVGSGRAVAAEIEFLPLGSLPGGEESSAAFDVSGDGTTVVGSAASAQGSEAFRWTRAEGMVALGSIPSTTFGSAAVSVSHDGSVIGGEGNGDRGRIAALVWRDGGAPENLGYLVASSYFASAVGVSSDGGTVLGTTTQASRYAPFLWTEALGMQPMDSATARSSRYAVALSGDGRTALVSEGYSRLWSEATGFVDIDASGDFQAEAISADGMVVVGSLRVACPSGSGVCTEAALWTAEEGIVGLGWFDDPLAPDPQAVAVDASVDGSVVVGFQGDLAFIWDEQNGMRDLVQVMLDDGIDLSDWLALEPVAISDDGHVVAGSGTRVGGNQQAWLAVVPEPSVSEPAAGPRIALLPPDRSNWFRSIRHARHARVSVVLFGSADFDVRDVEVETLAFGPGEAAPIIDRPRHHHRHHHRRTHRDVPDRSVRDVDRDGYDDLISHYRASETGLRFRMENDPESACLQGETSDGEPFEGCLGTEPLCGFGYELSMLVPIIVWARRGASRPRSK